MDHCLERVLKHTLLDRTQNLAVLPQTILQMLCFS